MENEREYQTILEAVNSMRSGLVSSIEELITFGGQIPENVQERLRKLAFLTGDVFLLAKEDGGELTNGNKPGLISLQIGDKIYTCGKNALRDTVEPNISKTNLVQEKKYERTPLPPVNSNEWEEDIPHRKEEAPIPLTKEEFPPMEKEHNAFPSKEIEEEKEITPSLEEYQAEEKETVSDFTQNPFDAPFPTEEVQVNTEEENKTEESEAEETTEAKEEPEYVGAQVIGGEVSVKPATRADIFVEEKRKAGKEFIFNSYVLDVVHSDAISRGKGSKMYAMIAPLKVTKFASNNVPIVVTLVNEGKIVTRSSYDSEEDGKNMVNIDINEFYFLVRGAFDENGNFMSQIVTTGLSNDAGDRINILDRKTNGNSKNAKNGHVKFRYDTPEGPGVIEVFPWAIGENEFTIVSKNSEFIDYLNISPKSRGLTRPVLHTDKGRVEVVCSWEDDALDVDLIDI